MNASEQKYLKEVTLPRWRADLAEHILKADALAVEIASTEERLIAAEEQAAYGHNPAPAGGDPSDVVPPRSTRADAPAGPESDDGREPISAQAGTNH